MKKPNPISHMTGYGTVYGFLLGMLYLYGFLFVTGGVTNFPFLAVLFYALILGALPGVILGFLDGCIVWFMTRRITDERFHYNFSEEVMSVGCFTVIGMTIISIIILSLLDLIVILPLMLIPFVIIFGTSTYATNRYYLKLKAWHMNSPHKEKAKHKLKNQLADDNTLEEIDIPEHDTQAKQMKH